METNMEPITITPEHAQAERDLSQKAHEVLEQSSALVITNDADYQQAAESFAAAKRLKKTIKARRDELLGPIKDHIKKLEQPFKAAEEEVDVAIARFERPMAAYQAELQRQRLEAERVAREEARRQREELEAKAREEEARMRAAREAEAKAREEAEKCDDPLEAALLEQEASDKAREAAEALSVASDSLRATALVSVAPVAAPKLTAAGSRVNTYWKHRVTDPALVPDEFWIIDEAKLAKLARESKDAAKVAGVEFFPETKIGGA